MDYITKIRQKIGHDTLQLCGACVIIVKENKVLLQKRCDNGLWALHGGCVELDEKVDDAAKRELFEETGLIADELTFFDIFSGKDMNYSYPNGDKISLVLVAYICKKFHGNLIKETNETTDLKWFDINDLPNDITSIDKIVINKFREYSKDMVNLRER